MGAPILTRDDPDAEPLGGNVKVTRDDWLAAALHALVTDGVEQVKVMTLAAAMGVSRSSFYWYFRSRRDLLNALLEHWQETNTAALVAQTEAPAATITAAVCNVHRCVVNTALFDTALDFAIRDWAKRDADVRARLDQSDSRRLAALRAMFARYGYDTTESETRARVLYYMQIGYDLAQLDEPLETRLALVPHYLFVFTGVAASADEIAEFSAYARHHWALAQGETP